MERISREKERQEVLRRKRQWYKGTCYKDVQCLVHTYLEPELSPLNIWSEQGRSIVMLLHCYLAECCGGLQRDKLGRLLSV